MRRVLLINPYISDIPYKLLTKTLRLSDIELTEMNGKFSIDFLPPNLENTFVVWYFAYVDQLESQIYSIKTFFNYVEDKNVPIVILVPEITIRFHSKIRMILFSEIKTKLKKLVDNYFSLVSIINNIKTDSTVIKNYQKLESVPDSKRLNKLKQILIRDGRKEKAKKIDEFSVHVIEKEDEISVSYDKGSPEKKLKNWFLNKEDYEMDRCAVKLVEKKEKSSHMSDICSYAPLINFWTESNEEMGKSIIKKITGATYSINIQLNDIGIETKQKIINGDEEVLFLRGYHAEGGLYFMIEAPEKFLSEDQIKISLPSTIWKVERRINRRLQFLPVEKFKVEMLIVIDGVKKNMVRDAIGISEGGILIKLKGRDEEILRENVSVEHMSFSISENEISVAGEVIWCRDISFKVISKRKRVRAGIQFTKISSKDQMFIKKFIDLKFEQK